MIISKISGGLGNQMFQYAYSKYLEMFLKSDCKYDLNFYQNQSGAIVDIRSFAIQEAFQIHLVPATLSEINSIVPKTFFGKIKRKARKYILNEKLYYIKGNALPEQIYYPDFDVLYLECNWQSKKYLADLDIQNLFKFRPISNEVSRFLNGFKNKELVSIHVRKGDYLNLDLYKNIEDDYYREAISKIDKRNAHFLLFSDDPGFLRSWEVLENIDFTIVSGKAFKDYVELYIMTQCKNNIITNSTFSWWGAFLNKHNDKIVICPKSWFNDEDKENNLSNLLPEEWIKI